MQNNELKKLFLKYRLALEVLKTKFNSLYTEFSITRETNPIEHIKYRIKTPESIEEKLYKRGCELTSENIEKNLKDIVGARIVCSFLSDMEEIIRIIKNDPQLIVINEKDYITNPKQNGYSSYHIIVKIPVQMLEEVVYVPAEIQIRTIAMDMWASLEHKIWYKKNIELPEKTIHEIERTSEICKLIDNSLICFIEQTLSNQQGEKDIEIPIINEKEFNVFMLKYEVALNIIENKINAIKEEYDRKEKINPIEHIKSRIKTKERIIAKLVKQNHNINLNNMKKYINDIAGIRIVCSFKSDLEEIVETIKNDTNLTIIKEKDYITTPKESGYSSYHLLVLVPVYLNNQTTYVKVEIQIRTIAMDMWASLEHKLCYQKASAPQVRKELKNLAGVIQKIDNNMELIIQESRQLCKEQKQNKIKKKIRKPQN